jgi:hypothetical protein
MSKITKEQLKFKSIEEEIKYFQRTDFGGVLKRKDFANVCFPNLKPSNTTHKKLGK